MGAGNRAEAQVRFSWSEPVNGFAAGAVALGGVGGTLSHWRTLVPGSVFTATVTPAANGRVTVSVPAAAARDDRGKANTASSNVLTATYDGTRPMVTITGPASKQSAPFEVLFLWSEPVMGFSPKSVCFPRCACRLPLLNAQHPEAIAQTASVQPHRAAHCASSCGVCALCASRADGCVARAWSRWCSKAPHHFPLLSTTVHAVARSLVRSLLCSVPTL